MRLCRDFRFVTKSFEYLWYSYGFFSQQHVECGKSNEICKILLVRLRRKTASGRIRSRSSPAWSRRSLGKHTVLLIWPRGGGGSFGGWLVTQNVECPFSAVCTTILRMKVTCSSIFGRSTRLARFFYTVRNSTFLHRPLQKFAVFSFRKITVNFPDAFRSTNFRWNNFTEFGLNCVKSQMSTGSQCVLQNCPAKAKTIFDVYC